MKMKVKILIAISTLVLVALILISCAYEEGYTRTEVPTPVSSSEIDDDCESEEVEKQNGEYLESDESEMEDRDYTESVEMEIESLDYSEPEVLKKDNNVIEQEQNSIIRDECNFFLENSIDLRLILFQEFDEMKHLFGNEVLNDSEYVFDYLHSYEVGLMLGVIIDNDNVKRIRSAFMDFSQTYNCACVHLGGIDGTSTRYDVMALFGDCPYNTRSSPEEERVGAIISYGYWIEEHRFAWFFFDDNGVVVAIHYFMAGS